MTFSSVAENVACHSLPQTAQYSSPVPPASGGEGLRIASLHARCRQMLCSKQCLPCPDAPEFSFLCRKTCLRNTAIQINDIWTLVGRQLQTLNPCVVLNLVLRKSSLVRPAAAEACCIAHMPTQFQVTQNQKKFWQLDDPMCDNIQHALWRIVDNTLLATGCNLHAFTQGFATNAS